MDANFVALDWRPHELISADAGQIARADLALFTMRANMFVIREISKSPLKWLKNGVGSHGYDGSSRVQTIRAT